MANPTSTRAYVTFLANGGDDVHGIVGLVKGLRKVESRYPLVVAVLPDVPEEHRQTLVRQGCTVREIRPIRRVDLPDNQTQFAGNNHVISYSKLRIWRFVNYSKMIYLNGDIQVYRNIDNLFDMENGGFYAVNDCFCSHTPQDCPQRSDRAPYFNAGMFVFEPSLPNYTHGDLLEALRVTTPTPFAEQHFLNGFFRGIYRPIHPFYNLVLPMLWRHPDRIEPGNVRATRSQQRQHPENWLDRVKVVQYCAPGSRPWRYRQSEENMGREDVMMLVGRWWEIYENEALN